MRILNYDTLTSHGNIEGRKKTIEILEAALQAADPYQNTKKLARIDDDKLFVGYPDFVLNGSPRTGTEVFNLNKDIDRIFVFGAGKGIQRIAEALEAVLGDYLTGGHILLKYGDKHNLKKVSVSHGGHPVPDENCVKGCYKLVQKIKESKLSSRDLVFTIIGNGASSLLTMPPDGINLDDVALITSILQIEKGIPTMTLNLVRNQVDQLKGGRITRLIHPAKMVHIIPIDLNEKNALGKEGYEGWIYNNFWLHTLPDISTPEKAIEVLKENEVCDRISPAILEYLYNEATNNDVLKPEEFEKMDCRIFGIMPTKMNFIAAAIEKSKELGYTPHFMMRKTFAEASIAGSLLSRIAVNVADEGEPFKAPCALIFTGELLVTAGNEAGVGGRNQEFALSAAQVIQGNKRIVVAACDTDGTDGPGGYINEEAAKMGCTNLAGGIVDGYTCLEAEKKGLDISHALKIHNSSDILWKINSGIWTTQNISIQDIIIMLIMDHDG
ncbi:MAG: DUF4147 domain-containing protein [Acetivibrionales bacterium]|jgi:glycerate 2-kinase